MTPLDQTRWLLVSTRTHPTPNHPDIHFVYAVLTTGIYCRPTCQSRLARRANVKFFDSAAAAETAGFRACKRCKPEVEVGAYVDGKEQRRMSVQRARGFVEERKGVCRVGEVAGSVGISVRYFQSLWKGVMGVGIGEYCEGVRRRREKEGDMRKKEEEEMHGMGEQRARYDSDLEVGWNSGDELDALPALPAFEMDEEGSLFELCASAVMMDQIDAYQDDLEADVFAWMDEDVSLYQDLDWFDILSVAPAITDG